MCEDEDFIRYHFGEMSPAEREEFGRRLESDEELAASYARFRVCVEDTEAESTPSGLADRTSKALRATGWTSGLDVSSGSNRCRAVDWTVGSTVVLLVTLALIPATLESRESARRAACAENLRQLGIALLAYSSDHGGFFPIVGPRDYAGLYAIRLADGAYLSREALRQRLLCPSSSLASGFDGGRLKIVVPTLCELRSATKDRAASLSRVMGGSYAYRFGYLDGGVYRVNRDRRDCRAALLGDAPNDAVAGSRNHGRCSQNILFQDGAVRFVSGCWSDGGEDHLFLNSHGEIAAGAARGDTVLAPSWARPVSNTSQGGGVPVR